MVSFSSNHGLRFAGSNDKPRKDVVWVRLYELPREYWNLNTLVEIGNAMEKMITCCTIYSRVCVNGFEKALDKGRSLGMEGSKEDFDGL